MKLRKLALMSVILLFAGAFTACNDDLEEISPEFDPTESQLDSEKKEKKAEEPE